MQPVTFRGWKPIDYRKILAYLGHTATTEEPWVPEYTRQAVARFMERWQQEPEASKLGMADVEKTIKTHIEHNVTKSLENRRMYALVETLRSSLIKSGVTATVLARKRWQTILIEVATDTMMGLWRSVLPQENFMTWDESLTIYDIKTVDHIINILNVYNRMYKLPTLLENYESYMHEFKPYTGDWKTLCKLARLVNRRCLERNKNIASNPKT
jgi:ABC-type dipeptide/oligopeptide/nickel transport system ATPase subunit